MHIVWHALADTLARLVVQGAAAITMVYQRWQPAFTGNSEAAVSGVGSWQPAAVCLGPFGLGPFVCIRSLCILFWAPPA